MSLMYPWCVSQVPMIEVDTNAEPQIHIQPTKSVSEKTCEVAQGVKWRKLMHRFGVEEVLREMGEVEGVGTAERGLKGQRGR